MCLSSSCICELGFGKEHVQTNVWKGKLKLYSWPTSHDLNATPSTKHAGVRLGEYSALWGERKGSCMVH